jgi:hypothetical protein
VVISSYKWFFPPVISPLKTTGPKREIKNLIQLTRTLMQNNKKKGIAKKGSNKKGSNKNNYGKNGKRKGKKGIEN